MHSNLNSTFEVHFHNFKYLIRTQQVRNFAVFFNNLNRRFEFLFACCLLTCEITHMWRVGTECRVGFLLERKKKKKTKS